MRRVLWDVGLATIPAGMVASLWTYLVPLYVLGALLLLFGVVAVLSRIRRGRYLRPIVSGLARVPLIGRGLRRLSTAALERSNPELASAVRKLERYGATKDPTRAQKAMSQLTAAERRAYLEAAGEQDSLPQPANRQQRRRMQRARRGR
ncbi:MAG: hypothetical protein M3292_03985 [Actinomycetota bacterium]|nr:hypothetical protein [Actinomycetota bacterium]